MEADDPGLGSYYRHQPPPPPHHQQQPPTTTTLSPTTNGMLPNATTDNRAPQMMYPHSSVPSAVSSPLDTGVRRKRGRPRKYGTPEQAAAAKRLSSSSSSPATTVPPLSPPRRKDVSLGVGAASTSTSSQKSSLGNSGQGFTAHIITANAGEDICHKIMLFMQQSKQEICVLSASGSISNASLRQPATSRGNISYEGRFDILSLCGSYIRTDFGGSTGGLSVCLSSNAGQVIGGSVDGPLIAAGPVQVIVGTFVIEGKKNTATLVKGDPPTNELPSPIVGASVPSLSFLSGPDSSRRNAVVGNVDQQNIDGYQFMIPNRAMPVTSPRLPDWRSNSESTSTGGYEPSGRSNQGVRQSDYDRFQD